MGWAFDRSVFWDDKNVLLLYYQGSWNVFNEYPMGMYNILRPFSPHEAVDSLRFYDQ